MRITKYGTYTQGQTECTMHTHLHDGILFSLKKKDILTHTMTWMDLEDIMVQPYIMLSSISQSQKDKYCSIPFI